MFENLTSKFEEIFSSLKKAPSLNEAQVDDGLRKIRQALLEADVALPVAKELIKREPKNSVFTPPYSTLQIGGIRGGLARNVIADQCTVDWELRPVIPEDGDFVNQNIETYVKDILLPEMRKVYPKANIRKEIIGEIIGFTKEEKSDAVNLVCNLTGDNSRDVVSFGTEAGLFNSLVSVLLFVVLDQLSKLTQLMSM